MVLDLGNNLDVLASLAKNVSNLFDASSAANEGSEHDVDLLVHSELQVRLVLLRHGRQVDRRSWQVAAFLRTKRTSVLNDTTQVIAAYSNKLYIT